MCITSKKLNFNYCVCLQFKKERIKCVKCKNAVCYSCKEGLCNKCPLCRKTGWKKAIKKNKIVPINSAIFIESKSKEDNKHCISSYMLKITKLLILLIDSYLAGLLTLLTFIGNDFNFKLHCWFPLIIGLFEFIILISCWYGCCGIKKGINEICF